MTTQESADAELDRGASAPRPSGGDEVPAPAPAPASAARMIAETMRAGPTLMERKAAIEKQQAQHGQASARVKAAARVKADETKRARAETAARSRPGVAAAEPAEERRAARPQRPSQQTSKPRERQPRPPGGSGSAAGESTGCGRGAKGKKSGRRPPSTAELRKSVELLEKPAGPTFFGEAESLLTGVHVDTPDAAAPPAKRRWCARALALAAVGAVFLAGVTFDQWFYAAEAPSVDDDRTTRAADAAGDAGPAPLAAPDMPAASLGDLVWETAPHAPSLKRTVPPTGAPTAECDGWAGWERTPGGYRESCLGGLQAVFKAVSLERARELCCAIGDCVGFRYRNDTASGMLMKDVGCGVAASPDYDGYARRSALNASADAPHEAPAHAG